MLDGKRYYAVFPDEGPVLRPRIRAVLDALGNLDKAFRQHLEALQPDNLDRDCRTSARWVVGTNVGIFRFPYRDFNVKSVGYLSIEVPLLHQTLTISIPAWRHRDVAVED
jgi:hypothetical protein